MKYWLIQPRDPLIFRDGRPFTADPGARATTLAFPYPSTLAGAARTLSVPAQICQQFSDELVESLLKKSIYGPMLVALANNGDINECYAPAPADALLLKKKDDECSVIRQWLKPLNPPQGAYSDLEGNVSVVGARQPRKDKPHPKAPAFWYWKQYIDWMTNPKDEEPNIILEELGLPGLVREYRTHVRITSTTQTADPGGLFQTSGLEFTWKPGNDGCRDVKQLKELGLVIATDIEISVLLGFLGGEQRIASWKPIEKATFPDCPDAIKDAILASKHCRMVLLTPAIFKNGHLPDDVLRKHGLHAVVKGAAVQRYQTVSGWDYKKELPKATRRMAPAGSVYFLELKGSEVEVAAFIDSIWMKNISDEEQDCRDGFGLAVLGTWDGTIPELDMSTKEVAHDQNS